MKEKKGSRLYRPAKWLLGVIYGRVTTFGAENLPEEPCIIVGNHTQLNGPISTELFFPIHRYTWCAGAMFHLKDLPGYAYTDFWSFKPKRTHWFYKLLSYLITPLCYWICKNANTIPVYRDSRIISTFKTTVRTLQSGASVVIFPEYDKKHNHILYDFQDRFIDIARLYYRQTGKELKFVPLYIAPSLRQMHIGKPVSFQADRPMEEERRRICDYLMQEITDIAVSLPRHRVVPYRNIARKHYPMNIPNEVNTHENTGC